MQNVSAAIWHDCITYIFPEMKTIYIVLFFAAAFVALYEQSTGHPNLFIMIGCIVIFMMGLMKLMSKVPSKNQENNTIEEEGDV